MPTGLFTGTYALGPSRTTVTARYLGPGRLTNYPETSATGIAAVDNHVRAVTYWELSENVDVVLRGVKFTVFGTVENLFDRDPEPVASTYLSVGTQAPYEVAVLGGHRHLGITLSCWSGRQCAGSGHRRQMSQDIRDTMSQDIGNTPARSMLGHVQVVQGPARDHRPVRREPETR